MILLALSSTSKCQQQHEGSVLNLIQRHKISFNMLLKNFIAMTESEQQKFETEGQRYDYVYSLVNL